MPVYLSYFSALNDGLAALPVSPHKKFHQGELEGLLFVEVPSVTLDTIYSDTWHLSLVW
jgi:hypothetical protein